MPAKALMNDLLLFKLNFKNHHVESTGKHVQVRSWEDLIHAAKRVYNITAKRVYTKTGKIIFNFTQVNLFLYKVGPEIAFFN